MTGPGVVFYNLNEMDKKKSYLEFYKMILEKVKFDDQLFRKEYRKALKVLNPNESKEFVRWVSKQRINWN